MAGSLLDEHFGHRRETSEDLGWLTVKRTAIFSSALGMVLLIRANYDEMPRLWTQSHEHLSMDWGRGNAVVNYAE